MEIFGLKIGVIFAVLIGAIWRVYRMKSNKTTFWGVTLDYAIVFGISAGFALLLLHPVMTLFVIPAIYENFVAIMLAMSAEVFMTKAMDFAHNLDVGKYFDGFLKAKGYLKEDDKQ